MRIFLDYCVLNDAMRDTSVLAKLRFLQNSKVELLTSTTVVGEAIEMLAESPKDAQYILIDLLHDLNIGYAHPKRNWLRSQLTLDDLLEVKNATFVPASERAHMALAMSYSIDLYVTSRAEARNLSVIDGLGDLVNVVDIDHAVSIVRERDKS
jgi:hypothetical protein